MTASYFEVLLLIYVGALPLPYGVFFLYWYLFCLLIGSQSHESGQNKKLPNCNRFINLHAYKCYCCLLTVRDDFDSYQTFHSDRQNETFTNKPWYKWEGKGKAVPLQAWSGPEGSGKLRLPDFVTTAQDGGKVVSLTRRPPLPSGNTRGTHFC